MVKIVFAVTAAAAVVMTAPLLVAPLRPRRKT
jgi:hypothetical protein